MNPPPRAPGSYTLLLRLDAPAQINVGRLGVVKFPAGWYVYCGSAFGAGGLAARLGRHAAGSGALHWHIGHLRRVAHLVDWRWAEGQQVECAWAQALARQGGVIIAPGFGSSDCRESCGSHLLYFRQQIFDTDFIDEKA